jgi:hypothetical protein
MSTYVLKMLEEIFKDGAETIRSDEKLKQRAVKYLEKRK